MRWHCWRERRGSGKGGVGADSHDPVRFNSAARNRLLRKRQRAEFENKTKKRVQEVTCESRQVCP